MYINSKLRESMIKFSHSTEPKAYDMLTHH